ncbi:hypothetical protein AHAS_Ahas14G0147700 [Arachis hypogaea]
MESRKRKQILEDSISESKSESTNESEESLPVKKQKTSKKIYTAAKKKRKHVIEDSSSEEENHSYDGTEIGTETIEEFLRKRQQGTPEPPKVDKSTPTMPPAPSKMDPAPEVTAAALLMMARTASYVPKELPLPSFSLGLTDSSQEEIQTQEGVGQVEAQVVKSPETKILMEELDVLVEKIAKSGEKKTPDFPEGKTPPTEKQTVGQTFDKFETPVRRNLMSPKMKEKCYLWVTCIRTYADDSTDEYDSICTLNAQQPLVLSKVHFASLKANSYIEADIRLEQD